MNGIGIFERELNGKKQTLILMRQNTSAANIGFFDSLAPLYKGIKPASATQTDFDYVSLSTVPTSRTDYVTDVPYDLICSVTITDSSIYTPIKETFTAHVTPSTTPVESDVTTAVNTAFKALQSIQFLLNPIDITNNSVFVDTMIAKI